ncbi:hypothetical protein PMI04_015140 [Sphingobium sp. AP49]|uniref:hypothetical protein n=1 Tax=Sphingobium sp. AP49 TaxID=1144307 RepID=UPI00056405E3|nr:hypothetical protein [Sphingobium sp. AP49]WHO37894.1 hypothetical protein PMI04_015140 [Sphingobium sp. AP49]
MNRTAGGKPLRFFAFLMTGWVAARLASPDLLLTSFIPSNSPVPVAPYPAAPASRLLASAPLSPMPAANAAPLPINWPVADRSLAKSSTASSRSTLPFHQADKASMKVPGEDENGVALDLMNFIRFTVGFANRHYASMDGPITATPLASPLIQTAIISADRWHGSAWLLWRPGATTPADLASVGRLGGSQAGSRLDYDLTPKASSRVAAYGRITAALERPAAPEAAIGLSLQPARAIPVSVAVERRIAIGNGARNAGAVIIAGGFAPRHVAGTLEASGYAQTGMVGFHARDLFVDGKFSLLAPIKRAPLRIGASISGGAQPTVERLDIGPEVQLRLPLPRIAARLGIEWRERIAGQAAPASGIAITLAADF